MTEIDLPTSSKHIHIGQLLLSKKAAHNIKDKYEQRMAESFFSSDFAKMNYLLYYEPDEFTFFNPERDYAPESFRPDFLFHNPFTNGLEKDIYVEITRSINCFEHKKRQLRVMDHQDEILALFNGQAVEEHIGWCFDVLQGIAQGNIAPCLVLPLLKQSFQFQQFEPIPATG